MTGARAMLLGWALLAAGCGEGPAPVPEVGAPAPAYETETLAGEPASLASLRGKVVLLNVWATWCVPCREEVPALQAMYDAHRPEGFEVVGVSVDAPGSHETIRSFAREFGVTYPIWFDPEGTVASTFRTIGVPNSYLIDREGTVTWKRLGPVEANDTSLSRALRETLTGS